MAASTTKTETIMAGMDQPLATTREGWVNEEIYQLYTDPDVNPYDVGHYLDKVLSKELYHGI